MRNESVRRSLSSPPTRLEYDLFPTSLARRALEEELDTFRTAYSDTRVLLVDAADDELFEGLYESHEGGSKLEMLSDMTFATTTLATTNVQRLSLPLPPLTPQDVRKQLSRTRTFAIILRKRPRAGRAFIHRIAVGRTRNADIVLQSSAVSRFHAWFEYDGEGRFFLSEGRSRNGTRVNGHRLEPLRLEPLRDGDHIVFGDVHAWLCGPDVFWEALNEHRLRTSCVRAT